MGEAWTAFPGLYCPGLIEAVPPVVLVVLVEGWFPGLYCPGLIEALSGRERQHAPPAFPGLYCPGLIEAQR